MSKKPGSQMGVKAKAILNCLRTNGRKNRLDLEMLLGIGPLGSSLTKLQMYSFAVRCTHGSATGCFEITRLGRQALGESIELPAPAITRICAATMRETYIPTVHSVSRVGLARSI